MTSQPVSGTVEFVAFDAYRFDARHEPIPPDDSHLWPPTWTGRVRLRFKLGQATVTKTVRGKATPYDIGLGQTEELTLSEWAALFVAMEGDVRRLIARHGIDPPSVLPWEIHDDTYQWALTGDSIEVR